MTRLRLFILVFAAWLAASPVQAAGRPVVVFAAASLKTALDEAAAGYAGEVKISYAASSALARQIESGAPADLFISADKDWMDYLAGKGLIQTASRKDLLSNHLALIAPAGSPVRLKIAPGMPLAAALGEGRLAVAAPEVPAGRYARASLEALKVWDSVKDRLAPAENVRAALSFVARGEAPLGVVYDTDAKAEPKVRIVGLFPDRTHPPIVYPAALTPSAQGGEAQAFLAYLRGPKAAQVFRRSGFIVLP